MTALLEAALELAAAGLSVVPTRTDGSKGPAVTWKRGQEERASAAQLSTWFGAPAVGGGDYDGLGIICGAVSGELEMLELEGRAQHLLPELKSALADNGFGALWERLMAGWFEVSPSGGLHWLYRVTDGPARRNTKLARRPIDGGGVDVLIETRGEGGFTVCAPSGGRTHPTGKPWRLVTGSPSTIPGITTEERDGLHAVCALFDAMPAIEPANMPAGIPGTSSSQVSGLRPGDDFNARATWEEILTPHGWTRLRKIGPGWGWRRPDKSDPGISATTGTSADGADRLYVFTTSTTFDSERPYSKFAAWAHLHHGGDYAGAAKALRTAGYGTPLEPHATVADLSALIAERTKGGDGASARVGGQAGVDGALATVIELSTPAASEASQTLERSEDGHAQALIAAYGDVVRHCADRGRWLVWEGHVWRWQPSDGGLVREYAKEVARALPDGDREEVAHKRRSLSANGVSGALRQAATDLRITVTSDQLDADPWALNTPNGTVDLRTGRLLPADPAALHTRSTASVLDEHADPLRWSTFLADTFGDDERGTALAAYLQRLVGYSAVGMVGPHILPFAAGSGGNGKGVFLETCVKVLGDYATTAPHGFLMAQMNSAHETEIARLSGARMVLCSEVDEDDRFDEAKVKQLTGGDTLTARFMRADHFTFTPTHQLWLMGNHKPEVRAGGRSFWRRLRLIPFEREVPESRAVDDLQGILAHQHGGAVLAWIVAGARAYAEGGLQEPETVKVATAEYAHDQDTVARFLEERCRLGGGEHVQIKAASLRTAYERWCTETGETPVTAKAFGLALRKRGVEPLRTKHARMYSGVALFEVSDDEENASPDASPDHGDVDGGGQGGWTR